MDYEQTLAYLYDQLPMYQRVGAAALKKDLTNTRALCAATGHPERQFAAVHVAGTNGKGSVSHLLAAALGAVGYRTGLYTSPHLRRFTERVRLNGTEIPEADVVAFVDRYRADFERIRPSFFEMTVALAFWHFARQRAEIAVVETGLGGRLDSTNVLTPVVSVITNVSYDHQDMLGETLPEIAAEKAGIIKPGVPVVVGARHPETDAVFAGRAAALDAPLTWAADGWRARRQGDAWHLAHPDGRTLTLDADLRGVHQGENLATALTALDVLRTLGWALPDPPPGLADAARRTGLRGRWETLATAPLTIADVAHNEAGLRGVAAQLAATPHETLRLVLGVVKGKDLGRLLPLLPPAGPAVRYYFCAPAVPRALSVAELAATAASLGRAGSAYPSVPSALAAARRDAAPSDLIFVGGSTFTVAETD